MAKERGTPFPSWTEIKYGKKKGGNEAETSGKGKEIVVADNGLEENCNSPNLTESSSKEDKPLALVLLEPMELLEDGECSMTPR